MKTHPKVYPPDNLGNDGGDSGHDGGNDGDDSDDADPNHGQGKGKMHPPIKRPRILKFCKTLDIKVVQSRSDCDDETVTKITNSFRKGLVSFNSLG